MKKVKRRLGDRKDAYLVRDIDAMHLVMENLYINRTDNEAYISETIDLAPAQKWIEEHTDEEFKYTFFHLIVASIVKTIVLRPKLNRFITNKKLYHRNSVSASFVVKRQFNDEGKEGLAILTAEDEQTVFDVHELIKKQVLPQKQGKNVSGTEDGMDVLLKMPRWLSRLLFNFCRFLDRHGWIPQSLISGDSNYASCFITNLGSIGLKCGYHHLSNWGTTSMFIVIGKKEFRPIFKEDGSYEMKEVLDIGLTIDERIADGYYYAKSVKILKYLLEHPEELEKPFNTEVDIPK